MADAELTIHQMTIRLPGRGREEARRLGEAVARHLADPGIRPATSRAVESLSLRLTAGDGVSTEQLAAQIAQAVRRQIV